MIAVLILGASLLFFLVVESELIELAVCDFYESVEEGGDGDAVGVVVDGCYFWGVLLALIVLVY